MGWKLAIVFVTSCPDKGYFATFPRHDCNKATQLVQELDLGPVTGFSFSSLEAGSVLKPRQLAVGAYEDGAFISGEDLIGFAEGYKDGYKILRHLWDRYSTVFCFELGSANDYAAYQFIESGRVVRKFVADSECGAVCDEGELLPEERAYLDKRGGRESRPELSSLGEGLTFSISARFLGAEFDSFPLESLKGSLFRVGRPFWPFKK